MRALIAVLRADASACASTLRAFLLVAVFFVVVNFAMEPKEGLAFVPVVCTMTMLFLPPNLFAQDQKSNLAAMYEILPVTRGQRVLGRYLFVGLIAAAITVVGYLVFEIWAHVLGADAAATRPLVLGALGLSFLIVSAVCSIQMCVFFVVDQSRAGMIASAATLLLIFGAVAGAKAFPAFSRAVAERLTSAWMVPVGIASGIALLGAFAAIATALYRRRDL